ncbi:hypothetical protein [Rufibacter latericius]|uniref:DNA-binding protein n=1 Tax=Rufibacter latericius TaxID=2487040 RepID=A0A3M9MM25_9BACT|nr:hypothetical protein [Rufibacter latericius]RNI26590.1 hypothetical protein EFB08_11265 [Rufibacter latericius]
MAYHFITPEELEEKLQQALAPIQKKIAFLEKISPLWLDTKQACKAIGVCQKTLENERKRPGTLIRYKYEGEKATKPVYCAQSLHEYNESKTIKRGLAA